MRIDGSIILDTQCIFEKDLPKVIVGNTWYITIQNKGDKVGKLWVPDVNGNPVCIGIQDITSLETRIQNAENQINVLNNLNSSLKIYTSLTQINSSFDLSTPIKDIYTAMPSNSILMYEVGNNSTTTIYPNGFGVCEIKKTNTNRDSITFHDSSTNTMYAGSCHTNFTGIFSGWVKLSTATEIAALETRITDLETQLVSTQSL